MHAIQKNAVRVVAKIAPWLAPFPSAYFVARSAMAHLALPLLVAVVVAAIIETLGLATVHTALWAFDWNASKRKSDPSAPVALAVALGGVYIVATLGLVVFLEVWPMLATYAPAIFPALAVVGAVNLALISRQEHRESETETRKIEAGERRRARRVKRRVSKTDEFDTRLDTLNAARRAERDARLGDLMQFYTAYPDCGVTRASEAVGVSRQTIYNYLAHLEEIGQVVRNNGRVEVLGWRDA